MPKIELAEPVVEPKTADTEDTEDADSPSSTDTGPHYAKDSPLVATPEEHAKQSREGRVGRPKSTILDPDKPLPVPTPRFRMFKSDAPGKDQRSQGAWNWWAALPGWAQDHLEVYVYREHPILLEPKKDEEGKPLYWAYIDKISGNEPLQNDFDLLHRYGCGNYKVLINEVKKKGVSEGSRTLCAVYSSNLGGADYKSNPPSDKRISDVTQVDLDHPGNKAYVSYLRGIGSLPSQIDNIRKEAEMGATELAAAAQSTTNKLIDTLISRNATDQKDSNKSDGTVKEALTGALDVMREGSKAAIEQVKSANEYAQRIRDTADANRPPSNAPAPSEDSFEKALKLVAIIQQGSGSAVSEVAELRRHMAAMQTEQVASLNRQVERLIEAQQKAPVPGSPFTTVKDGVEALKTLKETLDEIGGVDNRRGGGIVEDAIDAAGPPWLQKYAPLIGQVVTLATTVFQSRMQMPMGMPGGMPPGYPSQGMPPGYQGATNAPGFPPPGGMTGYPNGYPQQPPPALMPSHMPQPGPGFPANTPQPPPTASIPLPPQLIHLLNAIQAPLARHIRDPKLTGTHFADWFEGGFGSGTYEEIQGFGAEGIIQALYLHPGTAQALNGLPDERIKSFVAEFVNPNWEDEEEDEPTPITGTPAPPVPA